MNLVADEGVDRQIVDLLRSEGHDVAYVAELAPGITDEEVLREANGRGALLLTTDKDFGDLIFRRRLVHSGVVLLRVSGLSTPDKAKLVAAVFRERGTEVLNSFSVISPSQVRIRRES